MIKKYVTGIKFKGLCKHSARERQLRDKLLVLMEEYKDVSMVWIHNVHCSPSCTALIDFTEKRYFIFDGNIFMGMIK